MEILNNRISGLTLLVGSLIFLIAAFLPYSRIFGEPDPDVRLSILQQQSKMWSTGQVFFALGSVITILGLALLYLRFRESMPALWTWLSIAIMLVASLLWSWHCVERMISPEGFAYGTLTPGLFLIYSILTQAGLMVFGILLLGTDLPGWTGWMLIAGTALISVLMIIFKDMPPFVYYVFTLVLAIKLLTSPAYLTNL